MSLPARELTTLRADYEASLGDRCRIGTPTYVQGTTGEAVASYTWAGAIACGYDPSPGQRFVGATATPVAYDATVRLPNGTTITNRDRIRVTVRQGTTLAAALEYAMATPPENGLTGVYCRLTAVSP